MVVEPVEARRLIALGALPGLGIDLVRLLVESQHLVHLRDGAVHGDARVEMRPQPQHHRLAVIESVRHGDRSGNAEVVGDVEHVEAALEPGAIGARSAEEGIVEGVEIEGGPANPVVPPQRTGIALDELEEALQDRLLDRAARSAAVGIGDAEDVVGLSVGDLGVGVAVVAESRRQPAPLIVSERPGRRPFDGTPFVEPLAHPVEAVVGLVPFLARVVLALAEDEQ